MKQVSVCRNSVVICGLHVLEDGSWRQQVFTPSQRTAFPEAGLTKVSIVSDM